MVGTQRSRAGGSVLGAGSNSRSQGNGGAQWDMRGCVPQVSRRAVYSRDMEAKGVSGLTLPSFRKPPVTEVALSFGFSPLMGLQFAAMSDLRTRWATELPEAIEQPYLETATQSQGFRIDIGPPPRRLWFLNSEGDQVVQVQRDRLIANWRAVPTIEKPYPRYDALRANFLERWLDFNEFVAEQGVAPAIQPHNAEVTYINVIHSDSDDARVPIADVLKMNYDELSRDDIELTSITQVREVPAAQTTLTIIANVDASTAGHPVVLQIVACTRVDETRPPDSALDLAREFVVGTFAAITTDEMQSRWGRE